MPEAGRVSNQSEVAMVKKKSKFFGVSGKLKTIGKSLAQKHKINIEFGAGNPRTDGKNVYLPHLKPGVTNKEMDTFVGYIHHEVAHCNHSDMENDGLQRTVSKLQGKYSKNYNFETIKHMANIVEDVRIEQLDVDDSPGAIDYFKTMKRSTSDEILEQYKPDDTPESAATDAMSHAMATHLDEPGEAVHELEEKMKLNPHFEPMQKLLKPVFDKVVKDRQQPDALEKCTKELMRRVANYITKRDPDENMSDQDMQDAMDRLGQHIANGNSSSVNRHFQSAQDQAQQNFMDQHGTSSAREENNFGLNPGMGSSDRLSRTKIDEADRYSALKGSAKVRKAIVESMMSHKNKLVKRYQDQGILDLSKAHRFLLQGRPNIFKDVTKYRQINTCVDLAIDVSGSMGGGWGNGRGLMYQARKVAWAMDKAVNGTKIRLGMSVFDTKYYRLKGFNEKLTDQMIELIDANGGTDLGKAIYTSAKYISAMPEERKIVIAITDGGVNYDVPEIDALCRNAGIEIYYVVVASDDSEAKDMLQRCPIEEQYCAGFGGEFSGEFMKMFRNLILKGKIKHDD